MRRKGAGAEAAAGSRHLHALLTARRHVLHVQHGLLLQLHRTGELVRQPFMAKFDATATWFDELVPFTDQDARFFPRSWDTEAGNIPNAVQLTVDGD